mmetsp:Transcript_57611/g.91604  ORF Transcript_57611/g.91604 Transcript_57611/m.91604 type:complete len:228 (-) Transcript_57611:21-704(-)
MRLLTHNMLHSAHKRGVQKGYPLKIEIEKTEIFKQEMNEKFLKDRLPKLNWDCFMVGCQSVGISDIPSAFHPNLLGDAVFLAKCHHALLEVHIIDGNLVCPESGRKFPIRDGIPNMLLREDELPTVKESDLIDVTQRKKGKEGKANESKQDNEERTTVDANADSSVVNAKDADNPYLDPSLLKGLQQFSPQSNEQFMTSHVIDTARNTLNNDNDNDNDNDTDLAMSK